jgi:hypothetical protein
MIQPIFPRVAVRILPCRIVQCPFPTAPLPPFPPTSLPRPKTLKFTLSLALCWRMYLVLDVMACVVDDDAQFDTYCDVTNGKQWTKNEQSTLGVLEWQDGKLRDSPFSGQGHSF